MLQINAFTVVRNKPRILYSPCSVQQKHWSECAYAHSERIFLLAHKTERFFFTWCEQYVYIYSRNVHLFKLTFGTHAGVISQVIRTKEITDVGNQPQVILLGEGGRDRRFMIFSSSSDGTKPEYPGDTLNQLHPRKLSAKVKPLTNYQTYHDVEMINVSKNTKLSLSSSWYKWPS